MPKLYLEQQNEVLKAAFLPATHLLITRQMTGMDLIQFIYEMLRVEPGYTELILPRHPYEDEYVTAQLLAINFYAVYRPMLHKLRFPHKSGLLISYFAHNITINGFSEGKDLLECFYVLEVGLLDRAYQILEFQRRTDPSCLLQQVQSLTSDNVETLGTEMANIVYFFFIERGVLDLVENAVKRGPVETRAGLLHKIVLAGCPDQLSVMRNGVRKFRGFESCVVEEAREGFLAYDVI